MEINIKKVGVKRGTVGWLEKGIREGTIKLEEGHCKDGGNHGLWLKEHEGEKNVLSLLIALHDEYELGGDYNRYAIFEGEFGGINSYPLTPACINTIKNIGEKWCDECNRELDTEEIAKIEIKRFNVL